MKTILITGASSGLGYELAKQSIEKGYQVIGVSRTGPDLDIDHFCLDFSSQNNVKAISEKILKKYPKIDAIISCAAIGDIEELESFDPNAAQNTFQVNILGQSYLLSELSESIKSNATDIIFIGATIGYKANVFMPIYSITKWGLRGVIENWREVLKSSGSRVIGIHPGGLDTDSNIGEQGRETLISKKTGKSVGSLLSTSEIAKFSLQTIDFPKNMEISEVIINRK